MKPVERSFRFCESSGFWGSRAFWGVFYGLGFRAFLFLLFRAFGLRGLGLSGFGGSGRLGTELTWNKGLGFRV